MYEFIETSLEELLCQHPDASVVLAGDFNKLNVTEISVRKGLLPLVKTPTRSGKILDMLMISPPQKYQVKVIRSAVGTDHSAVLTTTEAGVRDRTGRASEDAPQNNMLTYYCISETSTVGTRR